MVPILIIVGLLLHIVLPALPSLFMAFRAPSSTLARTADLAAIILLTAILLTAGTGWASLGRSSRWIVLGVVLVFGSAAAFRARGKPLLPRGRKAWAHVVLSVIAVVGLGAQLPGVFGGREFEGRAVDLAQPERAQEA